MKLTYIVSNIAQVGGIERVVCENATWFADVFGYDVEIYSLCTCDKEKPYFHVSDKVSVLHGSYDWRDCLGKKLFPKIKAFFKKCNADVVITSHEYINLCAVCCKTFFKGKIIACEHHDHLYKSKKGALLDLLFMRFADKFVLLKDNDKLYYEEKGLKNCITIPNPIKENTEQNANLNAKRFVNLGRMTKMKGHDMLIDAFALVHQKYPDWKLCIVGDGEDKNALIQRAAEKGVADFVEMPGFVKNTYEQLENSSVFVLSSRPHTEGFPMCLLEAMSCGLPCCSYDLSAARAVLGDAALYAESNNIAALAETMMRFAGSPELRKEYSEKSLQAVKNFHIDKIAAKWQALFEELIQK